MGKYFGTDGVRGIANEVLTVPMAYRIGRFIGQYPNGRKNRIIISRDTRLSGQLFLNSLVAGIISSGSDVYNIGVSTTPSLSYLVKNHDFDYAIMISASHNPYYDNGIKIFNSIGEKLENEIELQIEKYMDSYLDYLPLLKNDQIGHLIDAKGLISEYIAYLKSKFTHNQSSLYVLLDCSNGSASEIAPMLFDKLGIKYDVINACPNGININDRCGSTHINSILNEFKKNEYDIGFAFDGDADRVMTVSKQGKVVNGDGMIFLNAIDMKSKGTLKNDSVVITVMSNFGLKKALADNNIRIEEVSVGDKYVQSRLKEKGLSLGGEQSGHVIFLDDLNTGDGLLTAIKMMNILEDSNGLSIDELLGELKTYPQVLKNINVTNKEAVLSNTGLIKLIKEKELELNGDGRVLVRASGTEPLIRVMVEAKSDELCNKVCNTICEFVHDISY